MFLIDLLETSRVLNNTKKIFLFLTVSFTYYFVDFVKENVVQQLQHSTDEDSFPQYY